MNPARTLFYDVDTQRDFILPGGRLYVAGAERVIAPLERVTRLARQKKIRIVASADRHFPGDRELKRNGGKYPDHCMDGTPGQRKIDATAPLYPLFVENREMRAAELRAALSHRGELVLEKQLFDVFAGNRNAPVLLQHLLQPYSDIVVYGVYTEVCVDYAVRGLARLGPTVHALTGALAAIGSGDAEFLHAWQSAGVHLITLGDLGRELRA